MHNLMQLMHAIIRSKEVLNKVICFGAMLSVLRNNDMNSLTEISL